MLEHESEWSNASGVWYMPIIKWTLSDGSVCGRLISQPGRDIPFMLSYN